MNSEQFIKSVENGEYPINKELLDNLYLEQEDLLKKMAKYRDKGDVGTYKNLVRSLADVTALIDNMWRNTPIKPIEKWQEKFSHCHTDGKELISTWEQKGEDIRNKKTYEVKEVVEQKGLLNIYEYYTSENIDKNNSLKIGINKAEDYILKSATLDIKINNMRHFHTVEKSTCNNSTCLTSYTYTDGVKILIVINGITAFKLSDDGGIFDISKYMRNGENVIEVCSVNNSYDVIADVKIKNKLNM